MLFCLKARVKNKLSEADMAIAAARAAATAAGAAAAAVAGGEPLSPTSAMAARIVAPDGVGPADPDEVSSSENGGVEGTSGAHGPQGKGDAARTLKGTQQGRTDTFEVALPVGSKPGKSGPGRPVNGNVPDK